MSVCNFKLPFSESPSIAVTKAKAAVESQNGIFEGNERKGNFEVSIFGNIIKGEYVVEGQILNLTITEKPFIVPCSMIESFLQKQIS